MAVSLFCLLLLLLVLHDSLADSAVVVRSSSGASSSSSASKSIYSDPANARRAGESDEQYQKRIARLQNMKAGSTAQQREEDDRKRKDLKQQHWDTYNNLGNENLSPSSRSDNSPNNQQIDPQIQALSHKVQAMPQQSVILIKKVFQNCKISCAHFL